MDETAIISCVLNGDSSQFALLVEKYWIGLVVHCEKALQNRADAEDVAQKSFIKAYEKLSHFDPYKSRFSTWLYTIAKNTSIDFVRSNAKNPLPFDEALFEYIPVEEKSCPEVYQAVKALQSENQRKVIEDYYWHGKSHQEIASEMGVSVNTVKTWAHRAKQHLKQTLL